ncbi:hypothetical protein EJ06DRAFT_39608 [Trichodelitschia bisporula]|uniref:Uncharacterized protein n=1 Tax=Trichodelitschia bisporula TaxID=703511 RepID=A0A6G1HVT6_9PEZI|nr:hypothetical protein EJ06DRAFT_39608 [Trichodelitschia bisporula]
MVGCLTAGGGIFYRPRLLPSLPSHLLTSAPARLCAAPQRTAAPHVLCTVRSSARLKVSTLHVTCASHDAAACPSSSVGSRCTGTGGV